MPGLENDPRVTRFVDTARNYCAFMEDDGDVALRVFVERCLFLLLNLFSAALELPNAEGELVGPEIFHAEYSDVVRRIKARLGDRDYYWMVFEPFETGQPAPIQGSISDDLADIWRDVKRGLHIASAGSMDGAVSAWRFSFESHWGPFHAANTFRPLFGLLWAH